MVIQTFIVPSANSRGIEIEPVFQAYEKLAKYYMLPDLFDIYTCCNEMIQVRRAEWAATFYPDDFYDGAPGKVPRLLLPDSMQGENNPFRELTIPEVQEVLEQFHMHYICGVETRHNPVVRVW